MKFFSPLTVGVAGLVGVMAISAIVSSFQRETTSVEDKYTYRSAAEIDRLFHASYLDPKIAKQFDDNSNYSDSDTPNGSVGVASWARNTGPNDDYDGDGLTNAEEEKLGTQIDNPDSDGDDRNDKQDSHPNNPIGDSGNPTTGGVYPLKLSISISQCAKNITQGDTACRFGMAPKATWGDKLEFIYRITYTNITPLSLSATTKAMAQFGPYLICQGCMDATQTQVVTIVPETVNTFQPGESKTMTSPPVSMTVQPNRPNNQFPFNLNPNSTYSTGIAIGSYPILTSDQIFEYTNSASDQLTIDLQ